MSGGKLAVGLPRYMMDCGWWRHPKFTGLKPDVLFVFQAAVGYCNAYTTDGSLPGTPEALAAALGIKVRLADRAIRVLIGAGIWTETLTKRIEIAGFLDHNESKSVVENKRKVRQENGEHGNHVRYRQPDAQCALCQGIHPVPTTPTVAAVQARGTTNEARKSDPISDPQSDRSQDSNGMVWDSNLVDEALNTLANQKVEEQLQRGNEIKNQKAYETTLRANLSQELEVRAREWVVTHPEGTVAELVTFLGGNDPGDPDGALRAARRQEQGLHRFEEMQAQNATQPADDTADGMTAALHRVRSVRP